MLKIDFSGTGRIANTEHARCSRKGVGREPSEEIAFGFGAFAVVEGRERRRTSASPFVWMEPMLYDIKVTNPPMRMIIKKT